MITLNEIRIALKEKKWADLRAFHAKAKTDGLEFCDSPEKLSTVNLAVLECSMFKGSSPGHERTLIAMMDAIERGKHPFNDSEATATMLSDAAIAQAQLDAMVGRPGA